jgi:hypothetical protein
MKPYDSDEELERALFALPLEEPPADLRASILTATIYRPAVPVKPWEIWAAGALCAVLVWLLLLIARGGAVSTVETVSAYITSGLALLAQPQTLFWIAIGAGAAFWISQLNLTVMPEALRANRR